MRSEHKKKTYEDKFARHFYSNSDRFTNKMKRANNKEFRRKNRKYCNKFLAIG